MFGLPLLLTVQSGIQGWPTLRFDRPKVQASLGATFERALDNLLRINTVPFDPKVYNRTGRLRGKLFIRAGGGYAQPWTRDAAINSWNAGSLLSPDVARDTLWSVTVPDERGDVVVQRDDQWWDKVIWIVGAWNHYQTTGDRAFLNESYPVAERLLREMRSRRYNSDLGLFQGPSFFNDGIAGYPAPPAEKGDGGSSFVLDHPGTDRLMALSTNCLYVGAYRAAAGMARELGRSDAEWSSAADRLKASINWRFWMPKRETYAYLFDATGPIDSSQEGSGLAFAALFDVADAARSRTILGKAHVEPFGVTDVYPHFARFSDERPGRHNAIVWPMVQGMWARAVAKVGDENGFRRETESLARLVRRSDGRFFEIYNAKTGWVDGGWQNGHAWGSEPDQTWSATAYLSMILDGYFGLRFEPSGIRFRPTVPNAWGGASLTGLRYRNATLDIRLKGSGTKVGDVRLDGRKVSRVPGDLRGSHTIEIAMR